MIGNTINAGGKATIDTPATMAAPAALHALIVFACFARRSATTNFF
jgi:hypothetical protein